MNYTLFFTNHRNLCNYAILLLVYPTSMSTQANTQHHGPYPPSKGWKTLDQLADSWGMDLNRARMVVSVLMDSGRMEKEARPRRGQIYRLVL